MSHFNFDKAIDDAIRMDAPVQRGPLMRWQRKALETAVRTMSLQEGMNTAGLSPRSKRRSASCTRTPSSKTPKTPLSGKFTPKTPGKTPGNNKTPGNKVKGKTPKKTPITPHHKQPDRFIPNRSMMDMEASHHMLVTSENMNPSLEEEDSPRKAAFRQQMTDALHEGQPQDARILAFRQKAPAAKEGAINNLKVLYSSSHSSVPRTPAGRQIPQQSERILDAPELLDDYYLNLLSWSCHNHLAVALGSCVYLWNAGSGEITQLMELDNSDEYISCISWIKEGSIIGVGNSFGSVQLWDVSQQKLVRTMTGHSARVGALSWNSYILTSGCRSGAIHHHDVRVAEHQVGTLVSHTQEVCGLTWSPDGRYLASGGNDNMLNIWSPSLGQGITPIHTLTQHMAAVKALAWCPWQGSILASGGGTADRNIRLWNATTGACLNSVDTNSQVCSILWSKDYKELISGHGFSQNQLTIWKYPAMTRVAELTGHTSRVLCLAMSPDGSTVASAAADETLRLWKCFEKQKPKKTSSNKEPQETNRKSVSMLTRGIR